MLDELACSPDGRGEACAVDQIIQAAFEQAQEIGAGIADRRRAFMK